jgi:uroporphyrinogen decarboxylase
LEFGERSLEKGQLTHRQRLEAVISGEQPDRPAVALWRHFPVDDQAPDALAAATASYQRTFDFDLVKVTPASSFCLRGWGSVDQWRGEAEGTRTYTHFPIQEPEDWEHLAVQDPHKGSLGAQLDCLRLLAKEFSPDTPILQTIFNPLSQAKNLVSRDLLSVHIRLYPEAVHKGLQVITETTLRFIEEAKKTGIDGIFYAVQHAQYGLFSQAEFSEFSLAYDLALLNSASPMWLNMLHLHGENVMFDLAASYPVQVINWHDRHTSPDIASARQLYPGVLCGGLRRTETMVLGTPEHVRTEAYQAILATEGKKFILGTGCVVPITAPYGNLMAARQSVEQIDLS